MKKADIKKHESLQFISYLKEKNKTRVIFDFDETLCTLLIDWSYWRDDMRNLLYGYEKTEIGDYDFARAQNDYIKKFGKEIRDKIVELNYKDERSHCSGYEVSEKALALLPALERFSEMYMWTSNDIRTVAPILRELGIGRFFKRIVARNDVAYVKPDPEGFDLIFEQGSGKSSYILIGDSKNDALAARNAGIEFIDIKTILE